MEYLPEAITESVLLIIVCLLATLGNASLFIITFTNRNLKKISNYYVLSLAFADLMVVIVSGPVTCVSMLNRKWIMGPTACTVFGFITLLTFVASVANLALIALNRYFFVVKWNKYKNIFTSRRAFYYGLLTWGLSIVFSVPPLFGWSEFSYIPEKSYCFVNWRSDIYYMYFMVILCFCGPLTVMTISYYKIFSFTKATKKKLLTSKINGPSIMKKYAKREARVVSPEETKLTNTLLIVVACFVLCWSPFAITMFFDLHHRHPIPRVVHVGSLILGYLNSMCNPIVYGIRSSGYRKGYINLFAKCFPCLSKKTAAVSYVNSSIGSDQDNSRHKAGHSNQSSDRNVAERSETNLQTPKGSHPSVIFNHKVSPMDVLEIREYLSPVNSDSTRY